MTHKNPLGAFSSAMESSSAYRAAFLGALLAPRLAIHPATGAPWQGDAKSAAVFTARAVHRLQSLTRSSLRYETQRCSYPYSSEAAESAAEKRQERRQSEASAIAALFGMECRLGGDPRGPCGRLIDPADSSLSDGYGDGLAIW